MIVWYLIFLLLVSESIFLILLLLPGEWFVGFCLTLLQPLKVPLKIILALLSFTTFDQAMEMSKEEGREIPPHSTMDKETYYRTKKFRAERNFYLCSFTLTLLLIILRLETLFRTKIQLEKEVQDKKKA